MAEGRSHLLSSFCYQIVDSEVLTQSTSTYMFAADFYDYKTSLLYILVDIKYILRTDSVVCIH